MIQFNYQNEVVSSPAVILSGSTTNTRTGLIQLVNNDSKVFPPQFYEVNNGHFKALVHVSPGEPNVIQAHILHGARLNDRGFPVDVGKVVDKGEITLHFNPLPENKPIHLCVVVGRDSDGAYDMPKYKLDRGERANLDTAIQRLKVAGRMMQAFTQDEFHQNGLSNRSFQFVEESTNSQHVFGYNVTSPEPHNEVKIHVLRSHMTVNELRSPDLAQQNPNAKNNGGLFSHAIDLVKQADFYGPYREKGTAIQCAVMYLDSNWNGTFITAHAALGGGTGEVKMAIFGSHGLHSYPFTFPTVTLSFLDDTRLNIKEVANDCNQCGTSWECLNICLGAFMHEIGHLLGSPHQVDGVMLRDYIWWNRQFMTREAYCMRDNSRGIVVDDSGMFPKQCHWNIMDLMRYFYHGSFSIPVDNPAEFPKQSSTLMSKSEGGAIPFLSIISPGLVTITSDSGIFMIELCAQDLARYHIPYIPVAYGGSGVQHEITLSFEECLGHVKRTFKDSAEDFDIRVLSTTGDLFITNFKDSCYPSANSVIKSDFNLGRRNVDGYKSTLLGSTKGEMKYIGFDVNRVSKVRVYHGSALDGLTIFYDAASQGEPKVPKRNYLPNLMRGLSLDADSRNSVPEGEVTLGNVRPHYTDFDLRQGEKIIKFHIRSGAWIDALEVETDQGRRSGMLGNTGGGHLSILAAPSENHTIVGLYGYTGSWMDGIGLIYAEV